MAKPAGENRFLSLHCQPGKISLKTEAVPVTGQGRGGSAGCGPSSVGTEGRGPTQGGGR